MTTAYSRELERLTSSGMSLADPAMDLREREVRDRHGEAVGTVSDLLLDPNDGTVRLLEVTMGGGLLGIGKKRHLVPVERELRRSGFTVLGQSGRRCSSRVRDVLRTGRHTARTVGRY